VRAGDHELALAVGCGAAALGHDVAQLGTTAPATAHQLLHANLPARGLELRDDVVDRDVIAGGLPHTRLRVEGLDVLERVGRSHPIDEQRLLLAGPGRARRGRHGRHDGHAGGWRHECETHGIPFPRMRLTGSPRDLPSHAPDTSVRGILSHLADVCDSRVVR
jgi:hypothetical protein